MNTISLCFLSLNMKQAVKERAKLWKRKKKQKAGLVWRYSHSNIKSIVTVDTEFECNLFCILTTLRRAGSFSFDLYVCDFGGKKVQSISLKHSTCLYDFSLDNCCSHWLCISACASVSALAAQAWKLLAALFLLYSRAQQGLAGSPGLRPHTHLASCIHLFILWISPDLSCLSSSCPSSLPSVPLSYFWNRMSISQDSHCTVSF